MTRTTTTRITLAGALGLSALVFLLSGCAGATPSQMPPSGESATTEPTDPGMDGMEMGGDYDVEAISIKFAPETITVAAGTTVRWVNGETITHTITSGAWGDVDPDTGIRATETPDGLYDVTLAPKGEEGDSFEFTYTEPGSYPYYCDIHLGMNATVIVE